MIGGLVVAYLVGAFFAVLTVVDLSSSAKQSPFEQFTTVTLWPLFVVATACRMLLREVKGE